MKNEERKRKFRKLFIIFVIVFILGGLSYLSFKLVRQAVLSSITVNAQNLTCTESSQILSFSRDLKINYFYFISESLEKKLKEKFFCIRQIKTKVNYPDKLQLQVFGREGVFILKTINPNIHLNPVIDLPESTQSASESTKAAMPVKIVEQLLSSLKKASESGSFLVDEEGMVFNESFGEDLPKLSLFGQELKIGTQIQGDFIKKIKQVLDKLKEVEILPDNLVVLGDKLIVDAKPRIIFSLIRPLGRQTASLQLILAQAKMNSDPGKLEKRNIESIDLRFDKPVVVYSGKK